MSFPTETGQLVDLITTPEGKADLSKFSPKKSVSFSRVRLAVQRPHTATRSSWNTRQCTTASTSRSRSRCASAAFPNHTTSRCRSSTLWVSTFSSRMTFSIMWVRRSRLPRSRRTLWITSVSMLGGQGKGGVRDDRVEEVVPYVRGRGQGAYR